MISPHLKQASLATGIVSIVIALLLVAPSALVIGGNIDGDNVSPMVSRILVMGDPHMGKMPETYSLSSEEIGWSINLLDRKYPLDFVVDSGDWCMDFVYDLKDYPFRTFVKNIDVPFFHIMGDHEGWQWEKFTNWGSAPPKSYYYLKDGILHIFINSPVSQWLAGTYAEEMRYLVKYLVEHKYHDKTTFIYSHYGVFGYSPAWEQWGGIGEPHANKFANYQDTKWWNDLFKNNPQIKVFFNGHTHNNIYGENSWNLENGVLFVNLEIWRKSGYTGVNSSGPTMDFPLVTISKENIYLVPYNLDRGEVEPCPRVGDPDEPGVCQEWTLEGPTSFDPCAEDEYGEMRVFLDNRKILHYNHVVGEERKIEIVRPESRNLLPDPEFRNTRGYNNFPPKVHGTSGTAVSPFWIAGGGLDDSISQVGDIIIIEDAKGRIGTVGLDGLANVGKWGHYLGDYPPAAEDLEFKLDFRLYSDRGWEKGVSARLYFQTDEWNLSLDVLPTDESGNYTDLYTNVKIGGENIDLSSGWNTYSVIVSSPTDVGNPSVSVPRLRVLPEFEFWNKGTYMLDWVKITPVCEDGTEDLINPSVTINGKKFETSARLGPWESVTIDAPVQGPVEMVETEGSGGRMGLIIFEVENPMIQTWGRPVKFGNGKIIAGMSRTIYTPGLLPTDIYMKSLGGVFTVGDEWTENVERAPKMVMSDIPTEQGLGMWDLSMKSDGRVDVRDLRAQTAPIENITWTARSTSEVTFTAGDLTEGVEYGIYADGSKISEQVANSWGEISFTYHSGGTHTFSVTALKPSREPWFVDPDDEVGLSDLMQVAGHFGEKDEPGWIPSDVDGDGEVGLPDLMLVAGHFGETR